MADALSTLLGLSKQQGSSGYTPNLRRPELYGEDTELYDSVPVDDPELYDEAAQSGYSREQLQRSQVAKIRQLLNMERAKAQTAIAPKMVEGEYGLRGEALKGRNALEVARMNREAAGLERQTGREFTAGQNELNREAITGRQRETQGAITGRTQMGQQGITQRQNQARAEAQARALTERNASGGYKTEPTYPPTQGIMDTLKYYLGVGKYDRDTAARDQANQIRSQALSDQPEDPSSLAASYADVPDAQLLSTIVQEQDGASPDEIQALVQEVQRLRGR